MYIKIATNKSIVSNQFNPQKSHCCQHWVTCLTERWHFFNKPSNSGENLEEVEVHMQVSDYTVN